VLSSRSVMCSRRAPRSPRQTNHPVLCVPTSCSTPRSTCSYVAGHAGTAYPSAFPPNALPIPPHSPFSHGHHRRRPSLAILVARLHQATGARRDLKAVASNPWVHTLLPWATVSATPRSAWRTGRSALCQAILAGRPGHSSGLAAELRVALESWPSLSSPSAPPPCRKWLPNRS
jgi:hypothetical protein